MDGYINDLRNAWGIGDKTIVVLFSGKAGVGKTTAADMLVGHLEDLYGKGTVEKLSFAHGVKLTAKQGFLWDGKKDPKGRKLLQVIGNGGREYNQNIWVELSLGNLMSRRGGIDPSVIVVDDWRYPSECEFFQRTPDQYRVFPVRIVAPEREILKGTPEYFDISENALNNWNDYAMVITNSGTMQELDLKVTALKRFITSYI